MPTHKEKFVIIDGNALLHRAWHALPPMSLKDGRLVSAAYGFTAILLKIIKELKPDYLCAAFDRQGVSKRAEEFKEYKAHRVKQPDELYAQIPMIEEILASFKVPVVDSAENGYEADDVIGTVVKINSKKNPDIKNIIVTGDLDALQLVDGNIEVYTFKKGISETLTYSGETVKDRYGLEPDRLIDFKALRGDPSDNIPGVKGIGEKTASELIQKFGSLEELYEKLEMAELRPRIKELLANQKKEAFLSKKLVTIQTDLKTNYQLDETRLKGFDLNEVAGVFTKYEFKSLLNKIPVEMNGGVLAKTEEGEKPEKILAEAADKAEYAKQSKEAKQTSSGKQGALEFIAFKQEKQQAKFKYELVNDDQSFHDFLAKIVKQKEFSIDTETTSLNPREAKLLGVSFAFKESEACYLNIKDNTHWLKRLSPILENAKIKKTGHNLKYDWEVLINNGASLRGIAFDTLLAAYLLTSGARNLDLDSLVFSELGYQMQPIEELIGQSGKKQLNMSEAPLEKVSWYSCEDADFALKLKNKLEPELDKIGNLGLLKNMEVPLIPVLGAMEQAGIKIDKKILKELDKKFTAKIKSLEEKIYQAAGEKFNPASPIQLKHILFDKLKIDVKGLKKIKTGVSTAAAVLEKLKDRHPIIALISEFREYSKLKNTYTSTLADNADEHDRIHSSFNQTIAATGRLSSSDPNLQNIPIRTDIGKAIRTAFVAERGNLLIAADYSQIELRVIASLSGDENMIAAFSKGEDIHARTAASINKIKIEEVTPRQRRAAKEINFGVIYGLGYVGLAQRAKIPREEAKIFIEKYFELHPKIKKWLENTKTAAAENGYVETLLGRRRYLPEIHSGVQMIRAAAERMAVNAPIQGTAADLLKMAMIKIHEHLPKVCNQAKMLLTVHDELVLEAPKDEAKKVGDFVKETMESVYKLKVPVVVEVSFGKNWGET